ncbi:RodZ domain-containing protein [Shewanella violacea]|uniref:Cytoskeleton protein RodZ-like C-terminal domain-containing protein n=1 Tax=Shewanella violacea (strain JCM 10179 / CIP 106290 / LMG 19151 / DSS12) TaxID=637905 RepID=D4ZI46_SHEVD|nr:RodZ domain-containing protein [Shewanella violacea]BAJ01345.1 conserved hypothetical protein [Shewanella violacea DSS12]
MTNKQINMLKDEADTHQDRLDSETIGSLLRQSRENMGASVADIAGQLKLRPCIVKDIEADNFDQIASPTYVKGYVKNFARIVQADEKAILRCLNNQIHQDPDPEMQSFSRKTTRQTLDGRLMFATYLIAFILLALLVLWWVQKSDTLSSLDISKPSVEELADSQIDSNLSANISLDAGTSNAATGIENISDDLIEHVNDALSGNTSSIDTQAAEISESISTPTPTPELNDAPKPSSLIIDETEAQAKPVTQPVTLSANQAALILSFSADCWLNVTDATGKVLVNDLKKAGELLNISGKTPFKLTLGAPQAVSIKLNGKTVSLATFPRGRVARLTLPLAG